MAKKKAVVNLKTAKMLKIDVQPNFVSGSAVLTSTADVRATTKFLLENAVDLSALVPTALVKGQNPDTEVFTILKPEI